MQNYLQKRTLYPPLISSSPHPALSLIITIPCYKEEYLLATLTALSQCNLPKNVAIEVIVLINEAINSPDHIHQINQQSFETAKVWLTKNNQDKLRFHLLYLSDLPKKHAGVGLARKIVMDEAVYRFQQQSRPEGIIVCLDADSLVEENYLATIHAFFQSNPTYQAATIHYEHPLEGTHFTPEIYEAITTYELHLRYYVHALKMAGLPTATQTVGSAMVVRAKAYAAQGGMNRRKAGEDFYFIHKFTSLSGFGAITNTKVIPSPRISDRVPFGTGKAVGSMLEGNSFSTYHPQIFVDLKAFLSQSSALYHFSFEEVKHWKTTLPKSVQSFLVQENFEAKWQEIKANTNSQKTFEKRFFRWFDAFLAMKYVHFVRDHFYPNCSVRAAAQILLVKHYQEDPNLTNGMTKKALLLYFRAIDRAS